MPMMPAMENMRPKLASKMNKGKGPRRPKGEGSMERKHRIKKFTKHMKRQRRK